MRIARDRLPGRTRRGGGRDFFLERFIASWNDKTLQSNAGRALLSIQVRVPESKTL
jgi:hypothetical protein